MNSTCSVIICILMVSATYIQGFAIPRGNRCLCQSISKRLNVMAVERLDIFPRSSACENTEYIATVKGLKDPKCVDPNLKEVKLLILGKHRHLQHIPVIYH